ncbi:ABC transporter [Actinomyces sp.]|nr:ABC transporter [Pauljensenia sp.]
MRWIPFPASEGDAESGSEVVSTVLVQGLAVLLILLLAQLAFASHVRTMSVSAASEGARRGGLLGGDEGEAIARTSELLDSLVGASKDREIAVDRHSDEGVDVLVVTVRTRLPLVGGLGPRWMTVRGRALVEGP